MKDDCLNRLKVKRGSELPHAKLNEDDVRLILDLFKYRATLRAELREMTNAKIAEKFGVHQRTIDRISVGENWGHVTEG